MKINLTSAFLAKMSQQSIHRHAGGTEETGAPPQVRCKQPTPEQMPPVPRGKNHGAQSSQITNLPAGYVYIPALYPSAQLFNQDASTEDSEHDKDCSTDMRNDEGTSTG